MFDFYTTCLEKNKHVGIFSKILSTHVWVLTNMYGKRHTCVKKATQLYVCKCWAFSTRVGKATDILISPRAIGEG